MTGSDKMEEPAKKWETAALEKRQTQFDKVVLQIHDRLDKILQSQVTSQQLEDRFKSLTESYEEKLKNQKELFDAQINILTIKFGSLNGLMKLIATTIIVALVAQIIAFFVH